MTYNNTNTKLTSTGLQGEHRRARQGVMQGRSPSQFHPEHQRQRKCTQGLSCSGGACGVGCRDGVRRKCTSVGVDETGSGMDEWVMCEMDWDNFQSLCETRSKEMTAWEDCDKYEALPWIRVTKQVSEQVRRWEMGGMVWASFRSLYKTRSKGTATWEDYNKYESLPRIRTSKPGHQAKGGFKTMDLWSV